MRLRCKPWFCLPALLLVVPVAFSTVCAVDTGPDDPNEESSQHASALVNTDSPWVGPTRDGAIPALPSLVSGARPPEAAVNATTSPVSEAMGSSTFNTRARRWLVAFPVLMRGQPNARTIRAAALVRAPERARAVPRLGDHVADRQAAGADSESR